MIFIPVQISLCIVNSAKTTNDKILLYYNSIVSPLHQSSTRCTTKICRFISINSWNHPETFPSVDQGYEAFRFTTFNKFLLPDVHCWSLIFSICVSGSCCIHITYLCWCNIETKGSNNKSGWRGAKTRQMKDKKKNSSAWSRVMLSWPSRR